MNKSVGLAIARRRNWFSPRRSSARKNPHFAAFARTRADIDVLVECHLMEIQRCRCSIATISPAHRTSLWFPRNSYRSTARVLHGMSVASSRAIAVPAEAGTQRRWTQHTAAHYALRRPACSVLCLSRCRYCFRRRSHSRKPPAPRRRQSQAQSPISRAECFPA